MNPYLLTGPACISFSGGRTSGYMLAKILEAHGGALPPDVHVIFANTGKERPETLDFVHECAARWGVRVRWVEWRLGKPRFREATYETASRNGEPFDGLIAWKSYLPNPVQRLCTQHLKIETMRLFLRHALGVTEDYTTAVGIRYDEPRRWRIVGQDSRNRLETKVAPLVSSRVTEGDVMAFWDRQPFDLGLRQGEGNCDLCFLKATAIKERIVRERPDLAGWWAAHERPGEGTRRLWRSNGLSYHQMIERARRQLPLFPDLGESEPDCACTD